MNIEATECTPAVQYDPETRTLTFKGESYPENVRSFYAPIFDWIQDHMKSEPGLNVVLHFSYLNTSSTKAMLDLLQMLEDYHNGDAHEVKVLWRYGHKLEVMREAGEELAEDFQLPIQLEAV